MLKSLYKNKLLVSNEMLLEEHMDAWGVLGKHTHFLQLQNKS